MLGVGGNASPRRGADSIGYHPQLAVLVGSGPVQSRYALAQQGNTTEGISQIRQGLAVYRAAGATIGIPRILGWLAEVYGRAGQIQERLEVLDEAFTLVERNQEQV